MRGIPRLLPAVVLLAVAAIPAAGQVRPGDFERLDRAIEDGIHRGVYPGAVVVVGRRDTILYARGYGHFTWSHRSAVPSADSSLFDLASLTKVVATTSAILLLVDRGRVDLDAPVSRYLTRFHGQGRDAVTVGMLLRHTSGLRSYVPFYRTAKTRDRVLNLLYSERPIIPPGSAAVYSDLNAMLLGLVVEQVAGEPLDRFVAREVFAPLGMTETRFRPPSSLRRRCVPSSIYRGQPVSCVVNDQNAAALGGVAGHAGLFSTAADLARYVRWWLARGRAGEVALVRPVTMNRFLVRSPEGGSRLLGWDTPGDVSEPPSAYGDRLSEAAFGHTGWTGTQIWLDPARDLFVVFLTNRSYDPHVSRSLTRIKSVRAAVADAAVAETAAPCSVALC